MLTPDLRKVAWSMRSAYMGCETPEEQAKVKEVLDLVIFGIESDFFGGVGRGQEFKELVYGMENK